MPRNIVARGSIWNFGSGALCTHKGWQYAAYWDDARQVSVARRQLPSGPWVVASLPGYQRSETGDRGKGGAVSQGFGDGHEKVAMGISPDGFIHLAFDHHVSTLHYRVSKHPVADHPEKHEWNASLFGPVQDHLGGERLEGITYPSFTVAGSGMVLYLRMGGGSGGANSHFFKYAGGRWVVNSEAESKFIDKGWSGGDRTVNAYPNGLVIRNGRWHFTWCWRDTPDETTCHDLCYAYSDDEGRTWLNNDGKVIGLTGTTFITADSLGVVAVKIPPRTRFRNGGSMTVDLTGGVHVLMRGEKGAPVLFSRDPRTAKWTRGSCDVLGTLICGPGGDLFVADEDGVYRPTTSGFGHLQRLVAVDSGWFKDSVGVVDKGRLAHDGWISMIGQQGKTIRVVDCWVGNGTAPGINVPSK